LLLRQQQHCITAAESLQRGQAQAGKAAQAGKLAEAFAAAAEHLQALQQHPGQPQHVQQCDLCEQISLSEASHHQSLTPKYSPGPGSAVDPPQPSAGGLWAAVPKAHAGELLPRLGLPTKVLRDAAPEHAPPSAHAAHGASGSSSGHQCIEPLLPAPGGPRPRAAPAAEAPGGAGGGRRCGGGGPKPHAGEAAFLAFMRSRVGPAPAGLLHDRCPYSSHLEHSCHHSVGPKYAPGPGVESSSSLAEPRVIVAPFARERATAAVPAALRGGGPKAQAGEVGRVLSSGPCRAARPGKDRARAPTVLVTERQPANPPGLQPQQPQQQQQQQQQQSG